MTEWLLLPEIQAKIDQAVAQGFELHAGPLANVKDAVTASKAGELQVSGRTAVIPIQGVLTQQRSWIAAWFGGGNTTYPDIIGAVAKANESADVDNIVLHVGSSPGGSIEGLIPAMDAIRSSAKPVSATVDDMATSAAYGLVSQAGTVTAGHRATQLGSVGIAMSANVSPSHVEIASTDAPKKRPDLATKEGQAVAREHLDDIHDIFVDAIAKGRGTTAKKINTKYGQGAVVLAEQALEVGMIDGIGVVESNKQTATGGNKKGARMDNLEQLKKEHPALYAEAVAIGATEERDRVSAHLKLGEASGDMKTAIGAIEAGEGLTASLQATYLAAGMNRNATEARADDNPDAGTPAAGSEGDEIADKVAALVEAGLGIEGGE